MNIITGHCSTFWSDPVIRPVSVRTDKYTTKMVTKMEKKKLNRPITRCFLKAYKSWIDYIVLSKYGLSAKIVGPRNWLVNWPECPPGRKAV